MAGWRKRPNSYTYDWVDDDVASQPRFVNGSIPLTAEARRRIVEQQPMRIVNGIPTTAVVEQPLRIYRNTVGTEDAIRRFNEANRPFTVDRSGMTIDRSWPGMEDALRRFNDATKPQPLRAFPAMNDLPVESPLRPRRVADFQSVDRMRVIDGVLPKAAVRTGVGQPVNDRFIGLVREQQPTVVVNNYAMLANITVNRHEHRYGTDVAATGTRPMTSYMRAATQSSFTLTEQQRAAIIRRANAFAMPPNPTMRRDAPIEPERDALVKRIVEWAWTNLSRPAATELTAALAGMTMDDLRKVAALIPQES